MSKILKCPKCSSDLGASGGLYCCWSSSCDFRSYRPWIDPPERRGESEVPKELEKIIGECLHATADGPFFVDGNAKDNPYWEYQILLGFTQEEVQRISCQWPNVDVSDEHVSKLIGSCFNNLIRYPHRREDYWANYFSVNRERLIEHEDAWKNLEYGQST